MALAAPEFDKKSITLKLNAFKKALTKNPLHQETQELIDKLLDHLPKAINCPPSYELDLEIKQYAKTPEYLEGEALRSVNFLLKEYEKALEKSYLGRDIWYSPDAAYSPLLQSPKRLKPKTGGAKNNGLRTGVYTFSDENAELNVLLKQGNSPGETLAEYIGSNLYALTIPDYSARCLLARDLKSPKSSVNDVYVGSIFAKGEVKDAFKAAGYEKRDRFAGLRARLHKAVGSKKSAVQKVLDMDAHDEGHSLAAIAANAIWHGDHDFHLGNVVQAQDQQSSKFMKIDHGFSLSNLDEEVVDIFSSTAGKVVDINPERAAAGGKLFELKPTNHYWDFGVEPKFYFDGPFIKACEDIHELTEQQIAENVKQSFDNIAKAYHPENVKDALLSLAHRLKLWFGPQDSVEIISAQTQLHIVNSMVKRKASIIELANNCREQVLKYNPERKECSELIHNHIKILTAKKKSNENSIDRIEQRIFGAYMTPNYIRKAYSESKEGYEAKNRRIAVEVRFFNMIKQAIDLGVLDFIDARLCLNADFYFKHDGERDLITQKEFLEIMDNVMPKSNYIKELKQGIKPKATPVSKPGYETLGKLKVALKPVEHEVMRKYSKR